MKHIIIGRGNLGIDLQLALEHLGDDVTMLTRSNGFNWPVKHMGFYDWDVDCVWVTAGFGSVAECQKDFAGALDLHVHLPYHLMRNLPKKTHLVLFSTDYAADEKHPSYPGHQTSNPKSLYAVTKVTMESVVDIVNRPETTVVRVGSLYGRHLPHKCFPGKLKARYPNPCTLELPTNRVTPTPTDWVATVLAQNIDVLRGGAFHASRIHMAPEGQTNVARWGRLILGEGYEILGNHEDTQRPRESCLGNPFTKDHWQTLWERSLR